MNPKFAYSFDRDSYFGSFDTRQQALDAAMKELKKRTDVPEGIFVAKWVEPNPQSTMHADAIIEAMHDRWQSAESSGKFLEKVTDQQHADLDHMIDQAIRGWLDKHQLLPAPTRVRAVSEHPVPNVGLAPDTLHERETSLIGEA